MVRQGLSLAGLPPVFLAGTAGRAAMTTRTPQQRPDSAPAHDHVVAFYDSDAALQQVAAGYLGEGLARGERLLAVVSPRTQQVLRTTPGRRPRRPHRLGC